LDQKLKEKFPLANYTFFRLIINKIKKVVKSLISEAVAPTETHGDEDMHVIQQSQRKTYDKAALHPIISTKSLLRVKDRKGYSLRQK